MIWYARCHWPLVRTCIIEPQQPSTSLYIPLPSYIILFMPNVVLRASFLPPNEQIKAYIEV